ncbi:paraneoplastic antigen Ma1 homolog [Erpetoichthys calabaricus]|uniref:paraneoplastic antigen Ma1 homolog n=1 Tax=Erpetoichthys calabaricus TaxID=27687 RepID=UPI00109F2067|nr:paraneoplastic antigen Ma1 homolog [Erpetoichthys calabaricus]
MEDAEGSNLLSVDLRNWCRGEGIDPAHAVMLTGISEDTEIAHIEEALHGIKVLGRVRVRGKMYSPTQRSLKVLCECRSEVDPAALPPEVLPNGGEGGVWKLVTTNRVSGSPESFAGKFEKLLKDEGMTMDDVQALYMRDKSGQSNPESIIRAVGELIGKTVRPSNENNAYRRLRVFSGVSPTPAGEEGLDVWVDQARLMVEECDCSDREKWRRLIESLKGPALEVIQAVRVANPDARPAEYIEAVENIFGTTESGEDLYIAFRMLRQQRGELLSAFLRRLEKLLAKVVRKGGLSADLADKARVEQLLRGATESEIMLLHLRLRERKPNPPSFLKLLTEIREEEEWEERRQQSSWSTKQPRVRSARVQEEVNPGSFDFNRLKAEISDLKVQLAKTPRLAQSHAASVPTEAKKTNMKFEKDAELQVLQKQVLDLQRELKVLTVRQFREGSCS